MRSLFVAGAASAAAVQGPNPVTRVAELMQGLAKQVEQEGKTEQKTYMDFKCWVTKTVKTKETENAESTARIEQLAAYIDDIQNGRIEFTTERQDLEKQLSQINAQLEKAKNLREQEAGDFDAAKEEMTNGITALEGAVETVSTGNSGGSFLARKFDVRRALLIGQSALKKEDYKYLEAALDSQPDEKDWNKINKKGDFKEKYEARSGGILKVLQDLESQFKSNLADAELKEKRAKAAYETLKAAKTEEKNATEKALLDMEGENGARGMNLETAQSEKSNLETEVQANNEFIRTATKNLEETTTAYNERKAERAAEVAAISEAISILRSDDARDKFSAVNKINNEGFFLQVASVKVADLKKKAATLVKSSLVKGGQHVAKFRRYLQKMQMQNSSIKEVIKMIDDMIDTLDEEGTADEDKKDKCKEDFRGFMKDMNGHSVDVDDNLTAIQIAEDAIAACEAKIEEAQKKKEESIARQAEAEAIRKEEADQHAADSTLRRETTELVEKAKSALMVYYEGKLGGFVQTGKQEPEEMRAKPDFTKESYGGKKGEATGVVAMLDMILDDFKREDKLAKQEEKEAIEAYDSFMADEATFVETQEGVISDQEAEKGNQLSEVASQKSEKKASLLSLGAVKAKYNAGRDHCNFYMLNFDARKTQRQNEKDGLLKAKTILEGGIAAL